jgi:hypothetical protein
MADLKISVDIDASGTAAGAAQAKAAIKGIGDEAERTQRRASSILDIDFRAAAAKLQSVGEMVGNAGQRMQQAGQSMSVAVTAPLAALATLGIKAALELDAARTKIAALTGSAEAANAKIIELRQLAATSVGVTQRAALDTYAQLKGIGGIAEDSINRVIAAMGKLNAAFKIDDVAGFNRNLVQIFSQGFERADIKEAIGRVPIFEQLLEAAFGTKDAKKLNELKKAGKLTLDSFMTGLSDAIVNDPRVANISENLTTRLSKAWEKLSLALAPIGKVILDAVLPIIDKILPVIQKLGEWFESLSPQIQTVVVAVGAFAAALGPLLIVAGGVAVAIGSLVSAIGTIAGAIGGAYGLLGIGVVLTGIGVAIAPVIAWIAALSAAWYTNFGGIRELTDIVVAAIKEAWNTMMAAIDELTQAVLAEVTAFWQENGTDIMRIVTEMSDAVKAAWTAVVNFWIENNGTIKAAASAVWEAIKAIVVGAVRIIGDVIKLGLAIINGDWSKAWDALKDIVGTAWRAIIAVVNAQNALLLAAVKLIFNAIWDLAGWVAAESRKLGEAIGQGIKNGVLSMADPVRSAARLLGSAAIDALRSVLNIHSPSRVTHEIGVDTAQGLADGITHNAPAAANAATMLGSGVSNTLKTILGGDLRDVITRSLDILTDGAKSWGDKLKEIFGGIVQNFRRMAKEMITTWLGSLVQMGGAAGQGPGGTPYFNPSGGGGIGGILGGIFGGGNVAVGSGGLPTGSIDSDGNYVVNGNQASGGGIFSGLLGRIFARPTNPFTGKVQSKLSGGLSGIGMIASVVGGFLPGRLGNVLSYAGMGLSLGSMFGPIGAGIGAAIGAIVGLFMGNPKEKRDKKEKMPQLEQGFTDALTQLRQLIQDVRTLRVSPDSALAKAVELRAQIAAGFGLQFESSKYQKKSSAAISQKLIEADAIIAELRQAAEVARAAGERDRRMLPEFAGGVYMSPAFQAFRRRNGFLGGAWTGHDTVPAMLAAGEMVLNPTQQARVRANAGHDVFRGAGIPGYAGGGMVQPQAESGPIVLQISHSIDKDGMVQTAVQSPSGRKVIVDIVGDAFAHGEVKTKRFGA